MRPYLRAIQGLGDTLAEAGNIDAAEFFYRRLESFGQGFTPAESDLPVCANMAFN